MCMTNVTAEAAPLSTSAAADVRAGRSVLALVLGPYGSAWVQPA